MKLRAKVRYDDNDIVIEQGDVFEVQEFKNRKNVWCNVEYGKNQNIPFTLPIEFITHFCEEVKETVAHNDYSRRHDHFVRAINEIVEMSKSWK